MDSENAKLIESLLKHPAWGPLVAEVERSREKYAAFVAAGLLRGDIVDQRTLDYKRGFFDGMVELTKTPQLAERHVERMMREREKV